MIKQIVENYAKSIRNYLLWSASFYLLDLLIIVLLIHVMVHNLPESPATRYKIILFAALILFYTVYTYSQKKGIDISENILCDIRETIIENMRNCDLQSFEKIDKTGGYNAITIETQILADCLTHILHLIEAIFLSVTTTSVIVMISPVSFWFVTGVICFATYVYSFFIYRANRLVHEAREKERELFRATSDMIDGFKLLKMHDQKNDDFYHQCLTVKTSDTKKIKVKAENMLLKSNVYSIIFEYGIFIPILFILPLMGVIQPDALMAVITLILLIPFGYIKNNIPFLVRGVVSIERLIMLENTLIQFNKEKPADIKAPEIKLFKEIQYSQICYHYQENTDFSLENISFCVYPNEIIFIRGGNGSGKTTLLKVITGLYHPGSGMVSIDGKKVDITHYRDLFSAIFTDFHLFDRLYGLPKEIDQKRMNHLLKIMDLDQKLSYTDKGFSTLDLSSGQKKRLAMIVSLMEDKPIFIFDEWAADQMPKFRNYFYHELLPVLRRKGKSIIAVTHDVQYDDLADQIIQLDYGRMK